MIYSVSFSRNVEKVLKKWKKSNPHIHDTSVHVDVLEIEGHYQDK